MTLSTEGNWSTIQVSNVPLDTTRYDLEQLFDDLGPVKKCFVLKSREGKKSTIGYVTFAMQDDCKAALKKEDLELAGMSLKLKIAPDKKIYNDGPKGEKPAKNVKEPLNNISKNKARLIIRNLSFKSDEDSLRKFFSPHGPLVDVNILKKPDGRMVGCAFVEFKKVSDAETAVKASNAAKLLGRTIAVDWAVPKEVFNKKDEPQQEEMDTNDTENFEEEEEETVESDEEDENAESDEEDENEEIDDEDENEDDIDNSEEIMEGEEEFAPKPHNLKAGHDINEGRTVFIRNLSYDTEEEDLMDLMQEYFGPVMFAKLVMDKVMGHPRGTAFVKFRTRENAEKCVEVGEGEDGVYLDNRKLGIMMAQEKGEVEQKQKEREKKEPKDNRNLYLAREGIIREGTAAAEGVSETDMTRRKVLEKQKKNLLKNLNMFVSSNRLCVRNLPSYVDDSKLRTIFAKEVPKSARITEAKVMKDMTGVTAGQIKSKEFGFVTFEKHEDALLALRNVNNNPKIFTSERRPVVEFSIENRKALLARQKRLEKSKEKNPNSKALKLEPKKLETKNKNREGLEEKTSFTGMVSDPKQKGLPTHSGPKVRTDRKGTKISRKSLKKQEIDRKNPKKRKFEEVKLKVMKDVPAAKKSKKEMRKQKKQSSEAKKEVESEKKFSSLVNQYRSNIQKNDKVVKKWFES
eukprot:GFUD01033566.1.p1 GENE.GFUD01033566.1~~GFUD01033566.1.p1  ORF type:complete len:687 (+),score=279.62 GFUD01033566.1:75-2135(+)